MRSSYRARKKTKAGEKVAITICSVLRFDAQGRLAEWKDYG